MNLNKISKYVLTELVVSYYREILLFQGLPLVQLDRMVRLILYPLWFRVIQKVLAVRPVQFFQHFQQVLDHLFVQATQDYRTDQLNRWHQDFLQFQEYLHSLGYLHHHQDQDSHEVQLVLLDQHLLVALLDLVGQTSL